MNVLRFIFMGQDFFLFYFPDRLQDIRSCFPRRMIDLSTKLRDPLLHLIQFCLNLH